MRTHFVPPYVNVFESVEFGEILSMVNYWMSAITRLRSVIVVLGLTSTLWMMSPTYVVAQLPNPALNEITPPGGQRGTTVRVNVLGRDLNGAHTLTFSHPGIVGRQVTREPMPFETGPQPVANQFDVTIPVNVPTGIYDVQAVGRFGVSTPRTFVVSDVTEISESGANHTLETATELPLDTVANGRTDGNAIDHYRFQAKQGETLVIECIAQAIDSRLQPVITVWNAEGRQIKRSRQLVDPILIVDVPQTGSYTLGVQDHVYGGGSDYQYRLRIHNGPYVVAIDPSIARPNQQGTFTLHGVNLPNATDPTSPYRVGRAELQQQSINLYLPKEPSLVVTEPVSQTPFGFQFELPGMATPNVFVASHPVAIDSDDNDQPGEAQRVQLPCDVAGRFYPRRDQDWFEFEAKNGQAIQIRVASHRFGHSTDPELFVQKVTLREDGSETTEEVSVQDDRGADNQRFRSAIRRGLELAHRDPVVSFTASHDGMYRVGLRDLNGSSLDDPRLAYRLTIEERRADFKVLAWVQQQRTDDDKKIESGAMVLRKGGMLPVMIDLFRSGTFGGPVEVAVAQLPQGVKAEPCVIASGQSEGILLLSAASDVETWMGPIEIVARAEHGGETLERVASSATLLTSTNNVEQSRPSARMTRQHTLAVLAYDSPAAHVDVVQPNDAPNRSHHVVQTCRGAQLSIPLKYVRHAELKGDLGLGVINLPANVKAEGLTLKPDTDTTELKLALNNDKVVAGRYALFLRGAVKSVYARNAQAVKDAETQRNNSAAALAQLIEQQKQAEAQVARAQESAAQNAVAIARIEKVIAQNEDSLKLAAQQSETLSQQVAELKQVGGAVNSDVVSELETLVQATQDQVQKTAAVLKQLNDKLLAAANELKSKSLQVSEAQQQLKAITEQRKQAEARDQYLEKQLKQTLENNGPKEITSYVMSDLIELEVLSTPIELKLTDAAMPIGVKRGTQFTIPVELKRRFGFADSVQLQLVVPKDVAGVSAEGETITAAPDTTQTQLKLQTTPDATLGRVELAIKYLLTFNGVAIEESVPLVLTISE